MTQVSREISPKILNKYPQSGHPQVETPYLLDEQCTTTSAETEGKDTVEHTESISNKIDFKHYQFPKDARYPALGMVIKNTNSSFGSELPVSMNGPALAKALYEGESGNESDESQSCNAVFTCDSYSVSSALNKRSLNFKRFSNNAEDRDHISHTGALESEMIRITGAELSSTDTALDKAESRAIRNHDNTVITHVHRPGNPTLMTEANSGATILINETFSVPTSTSAQSVDVFHSSSSSTHQSDNYWTSLLNMESATNISEDENTLSAQSSSASQQHVSHIAEALPSGHAGLQGQMTTSPSSSERTLALLVESELIALNKVPIQGLAGTVSPQENERTDFSQASFIQSPCTPTFDGLRTTQSPKADASPHTPMTPTTPSRRSRANSASSLSSQELRDLFTRLNAKCQADLDARQAKLYAKLRARIRESPPSSPNYQSFTAYPDAPSLPVANFPELRQGDLVEITRLDGDKAVEFAISRPCEERPFIERCVGENLEEAPRKDSWELPTEEGPWGFPAENGSGTNYTELDIVSRLLEREGI